MNSYLENWIILQWNIYMYAKKFLFVPFSSHLFPWTSTDLAFGFFSLLLTN